MDRLSPPPRRFPPPRARLRARAGGRRGRRWALAWLCALPWLAGAQPPADGAQVASPPVRAALDGALREAVGEDGYLGAVALVSQGGALVYRGVAGHAGLRGERPLRGDAIFRIYSMTKPVTSVAALVLVDEGRLRLDDPVARYLPAFAGLERLIEGTDGAAPRRVPVRRTMTVRHLLTHTAGFATGGDDIRAASALLRQAAPEAAGDLAGYAGRVASAPLADEPGARFRYDGVNTEVLARVIEVAGGQPFETFLRARVLDPLGMRDTGFEVPAAQRARVMDLTTRDARGKRVLADTASAREPGVRLRAYASGAGGLYSTAADYLRFVRMLENGGALEGARVLREDTVALMLEDQLARFDPPVPAPQAGEGFGLGGYVVTDAATSARPGSAGQFGWSGAASTWFTLDRRRGIAIVLMSQHLPSEDGAPLPSLATPFFRRAYEVLLP